MFCPKCGSLNQDELAFCRECGENLSVVSQAMKGHLSVALAARIDAVIEKKNERFRRDAVLGGLIGSAVLFSGILGFLESNELFFVKLLSIVAGVYVYLSSVWNFLAFRRSLELITKQPKTPADQDERALPATSPAPEVLATKLETLTSENGSIYCPKCGLQNPGDMSFCPSCGMHLEIAEIPTGMERYMPRYVLTRLDAKVARNEATPFKPRYRSWSAIMAIAALFLFTGIGNLIEHRWSGAAINFVLGLTLVVSGSWNLVAYRRTAAKDNVQLDQSSSTRFDAIGPFILAYWPTIVAVLAICAGLVWYFGIVQSVPLVIVALLILFGAFLRFWERQRQQYFLGTSSSKSTAELEPDTLETKPLAYELLSITEPTTQFLDPLMEEIEHEKALTTKKLADRWR